MQKQRNYPANCSGSKSVVAEVSRSIFIQHISKFFAGEIDYVQAGVPQFVPFAGLVHAGLLLNEVFGNLRDGDELP